MHIEPGEGGTYCEGQKRKMFVQPYLISAEAVGEADGDEQTTATD